MSENGFIQLNRSEKTYWFLKNHPNAFLLLTLIALRARRTLDSPDGLQIGECHIGDYESCGLTEQKYRTAKKLLEKQGVILISETSRNRKKSTNGTTTVGTKVKLLKSEIWDINPETPNERSNERLTTEQRPPNDEQECNNVNNERNQQPQTPSPKSVDVAVFSCLNQFLDKDVPFEEKIKITKKYKDEEQVVIDAVFAVTHESFIPRDSLLKSFRAALKGRWKVDHVDKASVEKNKKLSILLENVTHPYVFKSCKEHLEIAKGPKVDVVLYQMSELKFWQEVERQGKINLREALNNRKKA